jgi:hypothetical protein
VAVKNGLGTAKGVLEGYGRVVYKIITTRTQISPDMVQPDAFPDWGPDVEKRSDNLELWRRARPPETLHTTEMGWQVYDETLIELYLIWLHSDVGVRWSIHGCRSVLMLKLARRYHHNQWPWNHPARNQPKERFRLVT